MSSKQIKKAEKSLRQIAGREGIGVDTIRWEIEIAIAAARENPDPKIQAFWKSIPCKGEYPTPEETIAYIAGKFGENGMIQ